MDGFIQYLRARHIVSEKQRSFYLQWVNAFLKFSEKAPDFQRRMEFIEPFLAKLAEAHHDWQVKQAKEAILLYFHFKNRSTSVHAGPQPNTYATWARAIEKMVHAMRLKHLSYRTEKTYLTWMRQFYRHVEGRVPKDLNTQNVTSFLTHLAVDRKVSASTQNLAFNAILFFFRHVLRKEIGELSHAVRARKGRRLPVVCRKMS